MIYKWENESLEKYGEEVTAKLIKSQKRYEEQKEGNNCKHCGTGNHGAIIEANDGTPFLMRFGLWSNGRCDYCGIKTKVKQAS